MGFLNLTGTRILELPEGDVGRPGSGDQPVPEDT
jgi:hypothetical protein